MQAEVPLASHRSSAPAPGAFISLGPDLLDDDGPVFKPRKGKGKEPKEQAYKPPAGTIVKPLKPVSGVAIPVLSAKTLDWAAQVISPDDELFYQSAEASGVVANALQKSRAAWVYGGVLQKFSSSGKSKKATPVWQPVRIPPGLLQGDLTGIQPHNLSALGKFTVAIGPHIFEETKMWEVKWAAGGQQQPPQSQSKQAQLATAPRTDQSPPPLPSFTTKAASSAIVAQLSKMAANDPALSNTLRLAAAGNASQAELQSLQMYVAKLEQQNAALDAASAAVTPLPTSQSQTSPTSPTFSSSKDPQSPGAARGGPSGSPPLTTSGSPTTNSLQSATVNKPYGTTGYYPGMPRPAQQISFSPGVPHIKAPLPPSPIRPATAAQASSKPASKPTRLPSIILEFRENPGERWIVPDLFSIEEVASPPNGEALLTFFVVPATGVDSKGRPRLPAPAVKCQLQLRELSQYNLESLLTVAKTVPLGKRMSAWKAFEAERAELPNAFLQFRLPHPTGSADYQNAVEAYKAAWELKRKTGTSSAPLSGVSAAGFAAKKPKKPKKIKVMSALKAPKGVKGGKSGSITPKEETPKPAEEAKVETAATMEGIEPTPPVAEAPA